MRRDGVGARRASDARVSRLESGGGQNHSCRDQLDTTGHETVLYSFTGGADGANPYAGVIRDSAGNLYGTTSVGGAGGGGVVYKLDTAGHETVLYNFTGGRMAVSQQVA